MYDNIEIRVTLFWENCNDLNLHVVEPTSDVDIFWYEPYSHYSMGMLDIKKSKNECVLD